jgi:hypothetical protein
MWLAEKDDLLAGWTPRPQLGGLTLRDLGSGRPTLRLCLSELRGREGWIDYPCDKTAIPRRYRQFSRWLIVRS